VTRNGKQRPARPRIELRQSASPEEAAAIAPPPAAAGPALSPWARAALFEGTRRDPAGPSPWGDDVRWGA
jgi:hypothetical protein